MSDPKSTTNEAFYTTDAFTDYAIRFLKEELAGKTAPFLSLSCLYRPTLAFAGLRGRRRQVPREIQDRLGQAQAATPQAANRIRLDQPGLGSFSRTPGIPDWDSLDEKKQDEMDLKMAVYAAMIDRVDQNIGKLVAHLKESKTFDDTLIFFLADNGGCQEGGHVRTGQLP